MSVVQQQPLVSMMVPSFNHGAYVQECIQSIIDQDYRNIELIVIDDGSTDDSIDRIEVLVPACIARFARFEFRQRPNKGLSATVDEGLRWGQGEFFAALASDDALLPHKTSVLVSHISSEPEVAGAFGGCALVSADGHVTRSMMPPAMYYAFDDLLLKRRHFIVAPSQLLRRSSLMEVGGYPENLYIEDWYMWLKLTERGYSLKVISEILVHYRQHGTNISKNAIRMYEGRKIVLGYFQDRPGIKLAFAKISVMAAIDFSEVGKAAALRYLAESLACTRGILMTRMFWNALGRTMMPAPMIRLLRSLKHEASP